MSGWWVGLRMARGARRGSAKALWAPAILGCGHRFTRVLPSPPYALAQSPFRFRALVSLAERLPLGGEREVILATFLAARLVWDNGVDGIDLSLRSARVQNARTWLQSLALTSSVKPGFLQLFEGLVADDRGAIAAAWERLNAAVGKLLDGPARNDMKAVAARLARGSSPSP